VTESTSKDGEDRRVLRGTIAGTGLFLLVQYVRALKKLAASTGGMDNEFSRLAREDYRSFVIGENLVVLAGYLLLWGAAVLLLRPVVGAWCRRCPFRGRGSVVVPAFLLTFAVHGFFVLRLIHSRPYFLGNSDFGHWYYGILQLPPESWQPWIHGGLFVALPWVALAALALWWLRRMSPRWRTGVAAAALLSVTGAALASRNGGLGGPTAAPEKRPPNIIIIASDSLRGDRLGYTGYRPERRDGAAAAGVSPRIDAWAREAARFDRCYSPIASTLESAVTVMSSRYPHEHGIRHMYPRREQVAASEASIRTIGAVLAERGYDTAAIGDWCAGYYQMMPLGFQDVSVSSFENFRNYISQAVMMAHFVVPLYFDNPVGYRLFPELGSLAGFVTPEVVTRRVEDKLADQAASGRPFFWHVFYSSNHLPYASADPYGRMFTDPAYQGKNQTQVDFDINEFVSGTGLEDKMKALPEADIRQIRALYDGCTRQFDDCFGRILDALERNGLAENTIVVMTSDHGDDLYEPGVTLTHGLGFNGGDHCSHIPLAIAGPGIRGQTREAQVRSLDIAPTLLDLAGVEEPAGWTGRSLAGWIRGEEEPRDRPFYGETSLPFILFQVEGVERPFLPPMDKLTRIDPDYNHQFVLREEWEQPVITAKQRCLRTRNWKVVATPCKEGGRHYGLFHLATDPDCRRNLAAERPEVLAPMKAALERWIDEGGETPIAGIFPDGEP
jgi:arylsulfatase A-like enzyme